MAKCTFCGTIIEKGTGTIYVQKDGTILNFCSSKCEKCQLKLRRKPRTTEWTVLYQKEKKEAKHIEKKEDAPKVIQKQKSKKSTP